MIKDSKYIDNKELLIIPEAVHTDLYDGGDKAYIPFDKFQKLYEQYSAVREDARARCLLFQPAFGKKWNCRYLRFVY